MPKEPHDHVLLKDYAKHLNALAKKYPKAIVISSSDEEGNSFAPIVFFPAAGNYHGDTFEPEHESKKKVNAVCVN